MHYFKNAKFSLCLMGKHLELQNISIKAATTTYIFLHHDMCAAKLSLIFIIIF